MKRDLLMSPGGFDQWAVAGWKEWSIGVLKNERIDRVCPYEYAKQHDWKERNAI